MAERIFTDQMGNKVQVPYPPQRIVSLVPSQTELLFDLDLQDEVVGITKFCIHPEELFRIKTRVGGTKKIHFDRIRELQPDLIIANKEENQKDQVLELMKEFPVWVSDIESLEDALQMMQGVGEVTNRQEQASSMAERVSKGFAGLMALQNNRGNQKKLKTAYLIWKKPYMAAGKNTFINEMLERCGFKNVFMNKESRYPEVNEADFKTACPELILLSSEPYPFKGKHLAEISALCPQAKIIIVDGELFSWYGSRLLKSPGYMERIIGNADL